jgi:hypothetical protein
MAASESTPCIASKSLFDDDSFEAVVGSLGRGFEGANKASHRSSRKFHIVDLKARSATKAFSASADRPHPGPVRRSQLR